MSKIDRDTVRHLERLARVELSADEVDMITEQLGRIVGFVEKLQEADVEGVEPTRAMGHEPSDHVRDDVVVPPLERGIVLAQAPDVAGEFFRVPRVIDRGEDG